MANRAGTALLLGRAGAALVVLVACALVFGSSAPLRAEGEIDVAIVDVDDSAFPLVTAVITADAGNRPLASLARGDLLVTEGRAPATVDSVQRAVDANAPLALVLAVDTSGSMAGANLEQARGAASALVQRLRSRDTVAVIAFDETSRVVQPLTDDRKLARDSLEGLSAVGNTALYDAVGLSLQTAVASGLTRRAVVLLSDGEDFGGRSSLSGAQALERVQQSGVPVYAIGVGPEADRTFLREIAAASGGRYFEAPGAADVPAVYAAIEDVLRGQFLVTLRSTASYGDAPREIRVEVRNAAGQGVATRTYLTRRLAPGFAPGASTLAPTEVVRTDAGAESASESDGLVPFAAVLLAVVAVAVIAATLSGGLLLRRKRSAGSGTAGPLRVTPRASPERPRHAGTLELVSGPGAGVRFDLAEAPTTIGSARDCAVRLPSAEGFAPEHARIWWRDGRPMLHHLARGRETLVNGSAVDWASLEAGAQITLGPFVLRFEPRAADELPDAGLDRPPNVTELHEERQRHLA